MNGYFRNKIKNIKLDFIDLIVVLSYWLFFILLVLSLVGWFNKYLIGGVLLITLFFLFVFRHQIKFSKSVFYFFILIPLLLGGFFLFRGYFSGDALGLWLPLAREIVFQERMPDFLINIHHFANARMPLLVLFFAAIFVFLSPKAIFAITVPFFFISATALLLYQWAKDKNIDKRYLFFVVLLFLTNPITVRHGWNLFQEPLLLFFFTAFFYYLEKYQRDSSIIHFYLLLFSFVLAVASKFTGLILALLLFWMFIKNKAFRRHVSFNSFFILLPVIFWFARNYIIYDNPVIPFFNEIFKGKYYELFKASMSRSHPAPSSLSALFIRFISIIKEFLFVIPFTLFGLYGFWKKRKSEYIFFIIVFFILLNSFFLASAGYLVRYFYPVIGLLLIYSIIGLEQIRSRIAVSGLFFLSILGLFKADIYLSQSYFIIPFEKALDFLLVIVQFIHDYRLVCAIILSLFFYFFLSNKKYWQYLILLVFSSYLVTNSTIQISWLNIWLPILLVVFLILIWKYLLSLKESFLRKLIISYLIILLFLSSWGLALMFFISHGEFIFPKTESYSILPAVADKLKELEGDNKDFYIYASAPGHLIWNYNYKIVVADSPTLYYIINLEQYNDFTAQEIHFLFQKSNIKYIVENQHRAFWQNFYDKIKSRPDLFEVILEQKQDSYFMWKVKSF